MYIDVAILAILLIAVVFIFRRFSSFIYSICLIDIFLRIINFAATHIPIEGVSNYVAVNFPNSVANIIEKYTNGVVEDVLDLSAEDEGLVQKALIGE